MKKIYYLFLLSICCFQIKAQLSGVLSVPSTYTSLAAVISALNQQGVSGSVTVNIAAGDNQEAINPVSGNGRSGWQTRSGYLGRFAIVHDDLRIRPSGEI
jgi:hypothetical protein